MSKPRRLLCLAIGLPLVAVGAYVIVVHLSGGDFVIRRVVVGGVALMLAGAYLVWSAVTGR